jgi:hypothetical protein
MQMICKPCLPIFLEHKFLIPSRGRCHGVLLLCHSARLGVRRGYTEWIEAARRRPTFMAGALNLDQIARDLVQLGLASLSPERVVVDPALAELSSQADPATLLAIAKVLLSKKPPFWLTFAIQDRRVLREYIPQDALEDLSWIEPNLDEFLISLHLSSAESTLENAFNKWLGDAAELFIFAALNKARAAPIHVSKISDAYGYDIECTGSGTSKIEVKAASRNTQRSFHISRNEFDKSQIYRTEWRLIQVVFKNRAFVDSQLNSSHIHAVRQLDAATLTELVPKDTAFFKWTESALITAPAAIWAPVDLVLDEDFIVEGFSRE